MNMPSSLNPFISLGVDLTMRGSHAIGDCPFCGGDGKLSIDASDGLWRCFVCGSGSDKGGGNALTFARLVYERSSAGNASRINQDRRGGRDGGRAGRGNRNAAGEAGEAGIGIEEEVATDRRLARPGTALEWGVCRSIIAPHRWLIPGYGTDGKLRQIYTRTHVLDKGEWRWLLLPVKDLWEDGKAHALHLPIKDFDRKRPELYICEGPWDGMALWEIGHPSLKHANVVAVPGCNVWREEWTEFCRGKVVTFLYDSDHPRVEGNRTFRPGYDGMVRVGGRIARLAARVRWLRWGRDGWAEDKPDGWDVRDELSGKDGPPKLLVDRRESLDLLLLKVEDAPQEWTAQSTVSKFDNSVEPKPCHQWEVCEGAWKKAMRWRRTMSDALAVTLAVCASTEQGGKSQLFLQLVGSPGGGKTSILAGLLVSKHCHPLEHLTGFYSGWKKPGEEEKDCSLIARINGKTLITCEADTLMSDPKFDELMGQQRRIFDGKSSATYKNSDEDKHYDGLRTPWIMAGTPAMIDRDGKHQVHLGDRFIRFMIDDPPPSEEREILRAALRSERAGMVRKSDGSAGSILDPATLDAHALTGGYVNWLRANVQELIAPIDASLPMEVEEQCLDLATLTAYMRARPNEDKRRTVHFEGKETPTRLTQQYIRLAEHLAVVLNRTEVDAEVMRIVLKVALDTSHGPSLKVLNWLCGIDPYSVDGTSFQEGAGIPSRTFAAWLGMTDQKCDEYLSFMRRINIVSLKDIGRREQSWYLTDHIYSLYLKIVGGIGAEQQD